MTDVATLGLAVDSKPVEQASRGLDRFVGSSRGAERGAKNVETATQRMNREVERSQNVFGRLRGIMQWFAGFIGFTALGVTITGAINRLSEAERRAARLQSVLETTGRSKYTSVSQIKAFADEMERSTGVAADEVLAAAARLATFETIVGDTFEKAIKAALDFSEVYGGTLATNIEAIARALEDPVQGMAMLQKQGFKLTEEQKRLVKQMVQTGDVAGWQKVIFDQIAGTTGAAANAYTGLRKDVTDARLAFEKFGEVLISAVGGTAGAQTILAGLTGTLVFLTTNMDLTLGVLAGFSTLLLLRFIPAITAATVAVAGFTVALMRNPFGLIAVAIATAITYLVAFRNTHVEILGVVTTGGGIINAIWVTISNSVQTVMVWLDGVLKALGKIVTFQWSSVSAPMEEAGRKMLELARDTQKAWRDAFKTPTNVIDEQVKALGDAYAAAHYMPKGQQKATAVPTVSEEYKKLIAAAQRRTDQLRTEAQLVGQTGTAAAAFRFEMDLLARAKEQDIVIGTKQAAAIKKLAAEYGALTERLSKLKLQDDLMFERDQIGRSDMDARIADRLRGAGLTVDFNSYEAGLIRINEQLKLSRDLTQEFAGTFASEFRSALREGENFWQAFANAGTKALQRIADKLMDMAVQDLVGKALGGSGFNLFSLLGGSASAGGGMGMGAGLSGLYAKGAMFSQGNVVPFAKGGAFTNSIVSEPTIFPFKNGIGLMGEAGDEAIMPLKRGRNGRLGVEASGASNGGGSSVRIFLDDGLKAEIISAANDGAVEIVRANNRSQDKRKQAGG